MSLLMDALKKSAQSKQQQNHQPIKQNDNVSELLLDSEALEKELASIMAGNHESNELTQPENSLEKNQDNHFVENDLPLQLSLMDEHSIQASSSTASDLVMPDNENDGLSVTVIEPEDDKPTIVMADAVDPVKHTAADHPLHASQSAVAARQKNKYRGYGLLATLVLMVVGLGGGYLYDELNANSFTPTLVLPTRIDLKNRPPRLTSEATIDVPTASPLVALQDHRPVKSVQSKKITVSPKQSTLDVSVSEKITPKKFVPAVKLKVKPREQPMANSTTAIHSIKNKSTDSTYQLLLKGYYAYQRGDDITARNNYFSVLQRKKKNRDAMLGLAAIALRAKNYVIAQDYYTRLLQINSSDNVARGGLVSLLGELAPLQAESELKILLNQAPGAAYLHFALGNIYVSQSRWADAQQAFFKSYSADRGNADYVYNLAVSLDFLGEHKAALNYYREALTLTERKTMGFDLSAVENRIYRLQRIVGG